MAGVTNGTLAVDEEDKWSLLCRDTAGHPPTRMEHLHKSIAGVTGEAVSGWLRQLFLGQQIGRWFDVDLDNGHLVAFRSEWQADNQSTGFHFWHSGQS